MSLVAVGSSRGAPGATTLAMALAASWPSDRKLLIWEADADGGVLAARYGLGDQPGVATLAATARQGRLSRDQLWDHTQALPGGTPVVVGAESAEQATVVLGDVGKQLAEWFARHGSLDVIADVGRLSPRSPAVAIAEHADITLMTVRPHLEELRPAAHRLAALAAAGATVAWVLIGSGPYSADDVKEAFKIEVAGSIPSDTRAADIISSGGSARTLRRSLLIRSARTLAEDLCGRLSPQISTETPPPAAVPDEESPQIGVVS